MNQGYLPSDKKITKYYPYIIAGTTLASLGVTIFCLTQGVEIIYPHLYYIPITITALCYPKKGVPFTLLLTALYLFITLVITGGNPLLLSENFARAIVFVGIAAVVSTISQSLREDSLKYQRLFDHSGAATAVIDKSKKIIYCNDGFETITGYTLKELKRLHFHKLIEQNDLREILAYSKSDQYISEELIKNTELKILRKNKDICYTLATINRISELGITLFSLIDISETKNAERILRIKEERYKKLFQQSTDAIFIHSIEGKIFDANNHACNMTGYPLKELKEMSISDLYQESEKETFRAKEEALAESISCEFESRFIQSDTTEIDVDINSTIIDRETMVVQTIVRDITLRKRNENALKVASKKISILSSITRHDILNQIMVSLANLEFAYEDSKENNIKNFIEKAKTSVGTIQKQIEFSRDYQEMGGKPPRWHNIEKLIERCKLFQSIPKSVNIVNEISEIEIFADPMLEKVFCNLIGNSLMHGGDKVTSIRISFSKDDGINRIIYSDNGKGVAPDKKDMIFKAGYGSNQGYGLYLVKEILSITNISITENGTFGEGVQFELFIPKEDVRTADKN